MTGARVFRFNDFQSNCTVIWDEGGNCVIGDPGFVGEKEREELYGFIREKGLVPGAILLTHAHFDHIYGVARLAGDFGIPVYMGREEARILPLQADSAAAFGMPVPQTGFCWTPADEGTQVRVGALSFKALATPGHSPGGISWYSREDKLLLSGDTLFCGSIGRSDLPGGDYDVLMESIFTKITVLDGDTDVITGHGSCTTIADERQKNPFLLPFNEPLPDNDGGECDGDCNCGCGGCNDGDCDCNGDCNGDGECNGDSK